VWYRFHHGTTFTSWGEKITIRIEEISIAKTFMSIHSECGMPTQIIDWGKNNQNVCNIFEYIRRELQNPSAIPSAPSYEPKETYRTPEQPKAESVINFCNKCGARVIKDSNFCVNCGNKLR
jgi:hypothetical protein